MDADTFRGALLRDGARPNLFEVILPFPSFATPAATGSVSESRDFSLLCRTAQLPGRNQGTAIIPYMGREFKFPGNFTYPEWTVTVINDERFTMRNAFERWMEGMNATIANVRAQVAAESTDYMVNATVLQKAKTGENIKLYNMVGIFPIDITPIDVDWADNDRVEEFSVTFAMQYWTSDTTDGGEAAAVTTV